MTGEPGVKPIGGAKKKKIEVPCKSRLRFLFPERGWDKVVPLGRNA